jgi:hypothetical protein
MLDESGLAAPGWPLEHDRHLAVRCDCKQTDLATDLRVEWLSIDPILSDVDFASLFCHLTLNQSVASFVSRFTHVGSTINGTEAEDQAIWQGYQNTDKQAAFRFLKPILEGAAEVALYCAHRTSTF